MVNNDTGKHVEEEKETEIVSNKTEGKQTLIRIVVSMVVFTIVSSNKFLETDNNGLKISGNISTDNMSSHHWS